MSEIEVQDMMGKLDEGSCWGNWMVSEPACCKCVIMAQCSEATKKRQSGAAALGPKAIPQSDETVDDLPETEPLDYMLNILAGKYDRITKKNKGATAEYFNVNGKTKIMVVIGPTGIVKVKTSKGGGVVELESIEKVEKVLKKLL